MLQPSFWDNRETADKLVGELKYIKNIITNVNILSNSVNSEEPQEETKGGWTTRLWHVFAIMAFIIAGGIGKALGKEAYKHFPFIFGMITGSIIVSLIPYFLVKKYGK